MRSCSTYLEARNYCSEAEKFYDQENYQKAFELYSLADDYFKSLWLITLSLYETFDVFFDYRVPIFGKAVTLKQLGDIKLEMGDEKSAVDCYKEAITNLQRIHTDHFLLAELHFSLKDYKQSLYHYTQFIHTFGQYQEHLRYSEALCYKAFIQFTLNQDVRDYQIALEQCDKVIAKKNRFLCLAYAIKANILFAQEKYEEAEIFFSKSKNDSYEMNLFKRSNPHFITPKESKKYLHDKFNRDIKGLLISRVSDSTDQVMNEIKSLKQELNGAETIKKQIIFDAKERFYKLQKKFLDDCHGKVDCKDYKKLHIEYLHQIEFLKQELYQAEAYRIKESFKESKDVDGTSITYHLDILKNMLDELALTFIDFKVTDEKSLSLCYQTWIKNDLQNRKQRQDHDLQHNDWLMQKEESLQNLAKKLKELTCLKQELADNNIEGNGKLYNYFCDASEINSVDKNGFAPLHYACMLSDDKLAIALHQKGADKNIRNVRYVMHGMIHSTSDYLRIFRSNYIGLFKANEANLEVESFNLTMQSI